MLTRHDMKREHRDNQTRFPPILQLREFVSVIANTYTQPNTNPLQQHCCLFKNRNKYSSLINSAMFDKADQNNFEKHFQNVKIVCSFACTEMRSIEFNGKLLGSTLLQIEGSLFNSTFVPV